MYGYNRNKGTPKFQVEGLRKIKIQSYNGENRLDP